MTEMCFQGQFLLDNLVDTRRTYKFDIELDVSLLTYSLPFLRLFFVSRIWQLFLNLYVLCLLSEL